MPFVASEICIPLFADVDPLKAGSVVARIPAILVVTPGPFPSPGG